MHFSGVHLEINAVLDSPLDILYKFFVSLNVMRFSGVYLEINAFLDSPLDILYKFFVSLNVMHFSGVYLEINAFLDSPLEILYNFFLSLNVMRFFVFIAKSMQIGKKNSNWSFFSSVKKDFFLIKCIDFSINTKKRITFSDTKTYRVSPKENFDQKRRWLVIGDRWLWKLNTTGLNLEEPVESPIHRE